MFFTVGQRKALAGGLLDKNNVERFFDSVRNYITQQQGQYEYVMRQAAGNPILESLAKQKKTYLSDYNFLIDVMEAITLNSIEQRELLLKLADTYLTSDNQLKIETQQLKDKVASQEKEIKELAQHKDILQWMKPL